jgi:KDO2-lipid IV(A) lauroyltransferase
VIPIDVAAMRAGDAQTARRIGASSMREAFRVLRSGGVIAMALDRDLIGNGEMVPFFGEPAPIPVGVVDIAMRSGAAIVPIILHRNGHRVFAIVHPEIPYDPDAPRDAEVRRVSREVLALFESAIREHPDQWHVLDPIWRGQAGR